MRPTKALDRAHDILLATRPTAVNLRWALKRICDAVRNRPREARADAAWREAAAICDEDVETCRRIGEHGLKILREAAAKKNGAPLNVLTHCNAGWLACVDWGTALAPIYMAHDEGIPLHVWVDETRPRNQGASLTAFELGSHGVPHAVIADNAGGHLMQAGRVDLCIVGTDRVTRNGDVANKIGTYLKALAAKDNNVPFYVALPSTTIDWTFAFRRPHPHRGTRRDRSHAHDRAAARRQHRHGRDHAARIAGRQSRLRRDARAPRHRLHHRARGLRGERSGLALAVPIGKVLKKFHALIPSACAISEADEDTSRHVAASPSPCPLCLRFDDAAMAAVPDPRGAFFRRCAKFFFANHLR